MGISKEHAEKLVDLFRQDCENPLSMEKLLEKIREVLQNDAFLIELIKEKLHRERFIEIHRAREAWFASLGWWFAKLFMWSSLIAALVGGSIWGRAGVDAVTFALLGAAGYYVLIQLITPFRLSRETKLLEQLERNALKRSLEKLEEIERERGRLNRT